MGKSLVSCFFSETQCTCVSKCRSANPFTNVREMLTRDVWERLATFAFPLIPISSFTFPWRLRFNSPSHSIVMHTLPNVPIPTFGMCSHSYGIPLYGIPIVMGIPFPCTSLPQTWHTVSQSCVTGVTATTRCLKKHCTRVTMNDFKNCYTQQVRYYYMYVCISESAVDGVQSYWYCKVSV